MKLKELVTILFGHLKPDLLKNRSASMSYQVCPKCYGTLNKGHECGPRTLAKDDLWPKCLEVLEDCAHTVLNYSQDMLQIDRIVRGGGEDDDTPSRVKLDQVETILKQREERLLRSMENGRIKRG